MDTIVGMIVGIIFGIMIGVEITYPVGKLEGMQIVASGQGSCHLEKTLR